VVHTVPLDGPTLTVGRSRSNDLVLRHPAVSGHHALLFREGAALHIRDLHSRNGTWRNGVPLRFEAELQVGDRLAFGGQVVARVVGEALAVSSLLRLEEPEGLLSWPVDQGRFAVPGALDAELLVGAEEIWLAVGGQERARIELDAVFELEGRRLVLRQDHGADPTARPTAQALPYALEVDLPAGRAVLVDEDRRCTVRSAHRVALLYMLGQAWVADAPGPERGWIDDDAVGIGVWGRARRTQDPNNLNVLVHRLRQQVSRGGLDRWIIERRTGQLRLRVSRVVLRGRTG